MCERKTVGNLVDGVSLKSITRVQPNEYRDLRTFKKEFCFDEMKEVSLLFPHQLFTNHPALAKERNVVLTEDELFFRQFAFHKQKLVLHRASMRHYADTLQQKGFTVTYIATGDKGDNIQGLVKSLKKNGVGAIHCCEPDDYLIKRRLLRYCTANNLQLTWYPNPNFITPVAEGTGFFANKKHFHQADFYIRQRKQLALLLDAKGNPAGGKWSMDEENRKKLPKGISIPVIPFPKPDSYITEAQTYVASKFSNNPGKLVPASGQYPWAWTAKQAQQLLDQFLKSRLPQFGDYEDAIATKEQFLFHSLLTPMMNIGLVDPKAVVAQSIEHATATGIPLNSIEGFIRQVTGWREFTRLVYHMKGSEQRTKNYWGFTRKIPASFYTGTTGIEPVDKSIRELLDNGYAHHIERLMVLGNFFLLCEFDPNEVYAWFMELFIDAYDWVMVPNIYGMTQFADGGLMTTKPYISGSNYVFKMSDYKKPAKEGNDPGWSEVWDGLFWHFMHKQRTFFLSNPRLGMLVRTFDKMSVDKQQQHLSNADYFFKKLDKENEKTVEQG